ncbi:MAG: hypothetical protein AM325_014475, partial [Candidatus Thorarchaeota archaeon SMTZ1-45]
GESVGMKRIFDLAVHWQDRMDEVSLSAPVSSIKEATIEELLPALVEANLLPHNVIIYDWKALDVSHDALEKISTLAKFWVQSSNEMIESFSLGFVREDPTGQQWSFTIYARDDSTFLDQLTYHLKITSDVGCTTIFMTYQMDFIETFYSLDWVRPIEDEDMALTLLEKVL